MCSVCGCGTGLKEHHHSHGQHGEEPHTHDHSQSHSHGHTHVGSTRLIEIEQSILSTNQAYADSNRQNFIEQSILTLNLLSSPGSGKTTLLVNTIKSMPGHFPMFVIEGDQQTSVDADRIRQAGAAAIQINTGKGCHLDAHSIGHACIELSLPKDCCLFIENVGNLVCPADFDLGEFARVIVLSVTEGEDKPIKYPNIFYEADLVLLNKCDLLPYLDFDTAMCEENIRKVNPKAKILYISAKTGEGMEHWFHWLQQQFSHRPRVEQ